jgi:hypothetical protein
VLRRARVPAFGTGSGFLLACFHYVSRDNYKRRLECVSGRAHANVRLHAAAGLCRAVERRCSGDGLAAMGRTAYGAAKWRVTAAVKGSGRGHVLARPRRGREAAKLSFVATLYGDDCYQSGF